MTDTSNIVVRAKKKEKAVEGTSFRLEPSILEALRDESETRKTSINTLANQVFRDFIVWDRHAAKTGWVPMQRFVLAKLIETLDEKAISNIAKESAEEIGGDVLVMGGRNNLEGFLSKIRIRAKKSGFHIKERDEKANLEIIIHHDLGWKWSIFFKAYYSVMFNKFAQKAIIDFTENILVIHLPKGENV